MAGTYVIYYPPTTRHPFLVVTFLAKGGTQGAVLRQGKGSGGLHRPGHPAPQTQARFSVLNV